MVSNLSILIFILIFISPETPSAAVDFHFEVCRRPASCGDNQKIQYPFHIQDRQPPYCGYPGFMLKCHHRTGHPILHLSGRDFFVRNISYENHSFRLSDDAVLTASGCRSLVQNLSLTLPNDQFRLAGGRGESEICGGEGGWGAAERNGLVVEWTAGECRFCNGSGGFCGFDSSTHFFKCYCPDRPHALQCPPPG